MTHKSLLQLNCLYIFLGKLKPDISLQYSRGVEIKVISSFHSQKMKHSWVFHVVVCELFHIVELKISFAFGNHQYR